MIDYLTLQNLVNLTDSACLNNTLDAYKLFYFNKYKYCNLNHFQLEKMMRKSKVLFYLSLKS